MRAAKHAKNPNETFWAHTDPARRDLMLRGNTSRRAALFTFTVALWLTAWGAVIGISVGSHSIAAGAAVGGAVGGAGLLRGWEDRHIITAWLRRPHRQYLRGLQAAMRRWPADRLPWPMVLQALQLDCAAAVARQQDAPRTAGWATEWHDRPLDARERDAARRVEELIPDLQQLADTADRIARTEERRHDCCRWCRCSNIETTVGTLRQISALTKAQQQAVAALLATAGDKGWNHTGRASWWSMRVPADLDERIGRIGQLTEDQAVLLAGLFRNGHTGPDLPAVVAALL